MGRYITTEDIADEAERLLVISKDGRNAAKEGHDDEEFTKNWKTKWNGTEQTHTTRSYLDEGNLILLQSIGPTRSFICWNSSVRRINDEITGRGGNLKHWLSMTFSSEVSKKKVAEDAEGENGGWKIKLIIFVGGTSGSNHAQTRNDNLKEFFRSLSRKEMRLGRVSFMNC
jgi:hypothetical protein